MSAAIREMLTIHKVIARKWTEDSVNLEIHVKKDGFPFEFSINRLGIMSTGAVFEYTRREWMLMEHDVREFLAEELGITFPLVLNPKRGRVLWDIHWKN